MENDYRVNWPVPDEFLIEIGRIAALWASLESLLNTCIGKLAGFNEVGDSTPFILITHSSFPQRLDMLSALCEELKSMHPHLSPHKDVVAKLKSAQTARNRYAHNGIVHDPETDTYVLPQASARGKVKFTIEPLTVQEVHNAAKEVHLAMLALYKLVLKRDMKPVWERP